MITTTGSYWTTGIRLRWHERSGSSNGVDHSGWSATLDFYDSGFCDDNADTGRVSTEGTLRTLHTRYAVPDGEIVSGLTAAVDALITDARHLGITFNDPHLYYQGDGEDEEWPPPPASSRTPPSSKETPAMALHPEMPATENEQAVADYTARILARCRSAVQNHAGRPSPAWSHGEQMIVALVLNDDAFLTDVGTTVDLARERLHGDLSWHRRQSWSADELNRWIADVRDAALSGE